MAISASDWLQKGVGKPAQVYLVHGKEEGQKRSVLQKILEALPAEDYDRAHLDVLEQPFSAILAEALSIPAFSPCRVVMVRGIQHLKGEEFDLLVDTIPRLPETTYLILYTHAESEADERKGSVLPTKLVQAVERHGLVVECKPLNSQGFAKWLRLRLEEQGKAMTHEAQELFTLLTVANTANAEPELQKLLWYVGDRQTIEREDVEQVVSRSVEAQVFRLVDAIASRDLPTAMRLLHDALHSAGRSEAVALRLMALIARQYRLLWQVHLQREYGQSASQWFPSDPNLAQLLARQPFLQRSLEEQAQRLPFEEICKALERLHQTDRVSKGIEEGESDPRQLMERLVIDLCTG